MSSIQTFSGTGATGSVTPRPGRAVLSIKAGGSTYAIQSRLPGQANNNVDDWKNIGIPQSDGSYSATSTADVIISVPGGMEYRLNISSFSAAGYIRSGNTSS